MALKWQGKSRGTLVGYKIFVLLIKYTGLSGAYFLLCFVALYFTIFSSADRAVIYQFYRKRLGYGKLKSLWGVYKNFFVFGQTIIDKVAIFSNAK
nr:lipid A biosynthesis acyltransferase [Chitinophagales bacterium]